jgi:phosphoribosylformylglycinamidine (FGAM) synthase-like amidotransferase family enzyme
LENQWIVQYSDNAGRTNNFTVSSAGNASIAAIVADARGRLPAEADHPDKSEVEQEIEELEYRLRMLKQSIGQPA